MKLTDDSFDILPVPDHRSFLRIAGHVAAAGALAGGLEAIGVVVSSHLQLGSVECLTLAALAILVDAALGFGVGLGTGLVAQVLLARLQRWRRYRVGFTAGVVVLAAFFLVPAAREVWERGQRPGAAGMLALVACIGVMAWFNAGYWYRRDLLGASPRLGWRLGGTLVALLLGLLSLPLRGGPRTPDIEPQPGSPNLILITIDTLRRDHVGTYGSLLNTPTMDRLAREGLQFDDAVTTLPETAPSHSSMMTGLSPAVHGVVANGSALPGGVTTLAEQLWVNGYATGAFVSSYALDSSVRLDQGFATYDDDFLPHLRGLPRIRAMHIATKLLMRFGDPTDFPALLERDGTATASRALAWAQETPGPVFLWVHYFEPHSPYERHDGQPNPIDHRAILKQEPGYTYTPDEEAKLSALYDHEVEYTDTLVGQLLDGLRAEGRLDNAVVMLVADHGESMTQHGIHFCHHGLYEDVLDVPMILWSSKPAYTPGTHVTQQVLVDDVANTLLDLAKVPLLSETRSFPLVQLAEGVAVKPTPVLLMGRMGTSKEGGRLWGTRDPTGVKYLEDDAGKSELYDLRVDPGELHDIGPDQPDAVASGKKNVELLRTHVGAHPAGPQDASTAAMLEALGYAEPGK